MRIWQDMAVSLEKMDAAEGLKHIRAELATRSAPDETFASLLEQEAATRGRYHLSAWPGEKFI